MKMFYKRIVLILLALLCITSLAYAGGGKKVPISGWGVLYVRASGSLKGWGGVGLFVCPTRKKSSCAPASSCRV